MAKKPDALLLLGRGGLGSAAKNELQALLQACQQADPGLPVQLAFVARNLPALLNHLALATSRPDVVTEEGEEGWQTDPVAWSTVPAHQRHVLWCMGPRCVAKGAAALWPRLSQAVQASAPLKQQLQLLQTSCQYPCNQGPLMIVYPEGVWYGHLDEDSLVPVLKSHIEGSEACAAHRVHTLQAPPPCSNADE